MKVSLKVLASGKWKGKVLPIAHFPFLIGRDDKCHLRPASAVISKRHCGLFIEEGKLLLRDFDSTNGTFLNDRQVKGQIEVLNGDHLKLGVLQFAVQLETEASPVSSTSPPASENVGDTSIEDLASTLLLSKPDDADVSLQTNDTCEVPEEDTGLTSSIPSDVPKDENAGKAAKKL
jgi:pSer/pThr/pTyr-binding forkhead associated (FHA) protein